MEEKREMGRERQWKNKMGRRKLRERREAGGVKGFRLPPPFPRVCTLGFWESRSPITTVLPECCCLSLGGRRGEGGQTFTDEDPLRRRRHIL